MKKLEGVFYILTSQLKYLKILNYLFFLIFKVFLGKIIIQFLGM